MPALERDAALGWRIPGSRHMHEDGAAPAAHPRPSIVAQHDDEVVEPVRAPKPLRACRVWVTHRTVIVPIGGGVAPAVAWRKTPHGQPGRRPAAAIPAVEQAGKAPASHRRRAVALALAHPASAAAERAGKAKATHPDDAARCGGGEAEDCHFRCASSPRRGARALGHSRTSSAAGVPPKETCFARETDAKLCLPWKQSAPGAE